MKHAIIKEPAGHDRTDRVLIIISVICGLIAVAALSIGLAVMNGIIDDGNPDTNSETIDNSNSSDSDCVGQCPLNA